MTRTITYKQLQVHLHDLKAGGADVKVKLNSKYDVLLDEYLRLTCVPVEEEGTREEGGYTTEVLPAMSKDIAPSFLAKPCTIYWVDPGVGYEVDFMPYEVDLWLRQHEGTCCNLEVMEELEALTLQALEDDTVDNSSFEEHEEEKVRTSVTEPLFSGEEDTREEEEEKGGDPSDDDDVPLGYLILALPIYILVCCIMPASRVVAKALLRATDRHIRKLGDTEQMAWNNLLVGVAATKRFLLG